MYGLSTLNGGHVTVHAEVDGSSGREVKTVPCMEEQTVREMNRIGKHVIQRHVQVGTLIPTLLQIISTQREKLNLVNVI